MAGLRRCRSNGRLLTLCALMCACLLLLYGNQPSRWGISAKLSGRHMFELDGASRSRAVGDLLSSPGLDSYIPLFVLLHSLPYHLKLRCPHHDCQTTT